MQDELTTKETRSLEKFQRLLHDMFRSDHSDLDFGIYRIMNHRRDVIDEFIRKTLPDRIKADLEREYRQKEIPTDVPKEVTRRVKDMFGPSAIGADGKLEARFRDTPLGNEYLNTKEQAADLGDLHHIEADIYNHLHRFFSRYYHDGDFISRYRHSSGRQRYMIPYNGEEVHLYWANSDQYYTKTTEHFHDYNWKTPSGWTVRFELCNVDVEHDNVKGAKRRFLPQVNKIRWDMKTKVVIIPFEYRPLTVQEAKKYSKNNQQSNIILAAVDSISDRLTKISPDLAVALLGERRYNGNDPTSNLKIHLERYTRYNTFDFFIHKDLKMFLSRELDFYLKGEVLNLDHMDRAGESNTDGWFQKMRLVKSVGGDIIDFLAQIENFQKMLWEKCKFVAETHYCVVVGRIDQSLYQKIASNKNQWAEWCQMLGVGGVSRKIDFIKKHPTLVVDTRHFDQEFTDELLSSVDNLDEVTDGLLIHGENWQALRLLRETYLKRVKCIYIDPPYNTAASEIIYKNGYKYSSWLSLMSERITLSQSLLDANGSLVASIDDTEMAQLSLLLDLTLPAYDRNVVIVNHHPAGSGLENANVSSTHEYALFMTPTRIKVLRGAKNTTDVSEIGFVRTGTADSNMRQGRPNSFYAVLVDPATSTVLGAEPPPEGSDYPRGQTSEGLIRIYPVSNNGTERVWRRSHKTITSCIAKGEIICKNNRSLYLRTEQAGKRRPLFSNWTETKYNAGVHGSNLLKCILGNAGVFSYPKSINTVKDCVDACIPDVRDAIVMDYFAGSGTTGHAVINLNREDGGHRKFILVEMAEYFDTILLPRIKRISYSPKWKDGMPEFPTTAEEVERGPQLIKYMRLESYEDTLNNIEFASRAQTTLGDDYMIKYMLQCETKESSTLLNVKNLISPFSYTLRMRVDGQTKTTTVDIPETFNYLLGLNVRTRRVYHDNDRRYLVYRGQTRNEPEREMVAIWRETAGWKKRDFERDKTFVMKHNLVARDGTTYVNGDSLIPDARPVEGLFRDRMFTKQECDV